MSYNSSEYWVERGKSEFEREHNRPLHEQFFYHKYFLDKIDKQLFKVFDTLSFDTVLEVGCGWGFMSKKLLTRYSNIIEYVGIDISDYQLNYSEKYVNDNRFYNFNGDILNGIFKKDFYDLVFESTVFIHITPPDIKKAIKNSFDGCTKYMVSWDWFDPNMLGASYGGYCFNHNYPELYLRAGASRVETFKINHSLGFLKNFHIPKVSKYFSYPSALIVAYK